MRNVTRWITQTAMLLALCVVFQSLRAWIPGFAQFPGQQFIIGSLVNMTLIIAAWSTGFWSGTAISVLAAVIAFIMGQIPVPHIVPLIALGNIAIVSFTWLLKGKYRIVGVVVGAAAKFALLWVGIVKIILPFALDSKIIKEKQFEMLSANFSWPQLITALIGGGIALIIWPRLKKALKVKL